MKPFTVVVNRHGPLCDYLELDDVSERLYVANRIMADKACNAGEPAILELMDADRRDLRAASIDFEPRRSDYEIALILHGHVEVALFGWQAGAQP